MTEEEIISGNKLIADFVGLKIYWQPTNHFNTDGDWQIDCPDFLDHDSQLLYLYNEEFPMCSLKFHSDWNWLMPVFEKIKQLKHPIYIYQSHIQNSVEIFRLNDNGSYIVRKSSTKETCINLSWSAVVEFIKWHNNQPRA